MADTAQPPNSATAAGTTSSSPLKSTSAEVPPRALKTPVLPPQVPLVDPSAVPVPSCASDPTSSVPSEAVKISPVKPSSDPFLPPTTPTSSSPLKSTSAEVPPRAPKTPVLPPQVPLVDPSAVPVPSCASDPTSSVPSEAVKTSPVKPSSDPFLLPTTPTSLSHLKSTSAEVPPRALKTPVLPPQVQLVDPSAVPVPACASDPTSSVLSEAVKTSPVKTSPVKPSSDPFLLPTTPTSSCVVSSNPPASLPVSESSALPDQVSPPSFSSAPSKVLPPSSTSDKTPDSHSDSTLESGDKSSGQQKTAFQHVKEVVSEVVAKIPDQGSSFGSTSVANALPTETAKSLTVSENKIDASERKIDDEAELMETQPTETAKSLTVSEDKIDASEKKIDDEAELMETQPTETAKSLTVSEDKIDASEKKIDDEAELMETQQTDSQSFVLNSKDNQDKCAKILKDDSKQTNNVLASSLESKNTLKTSLELDVKKKLLTRTNELPSGTTVSSVYNVDTEKRVETVDKTLLNPVEKTVGTLQGSLTDSTATTPCDSQAIKRLPQESKNLCSLKSQEKAMSIGETNKSTDTNSFQNMESNSLGEISKESNEKESLIHSSIRKDEISENYEKTAENQKNEIHLSESMSATEGNVCNNVGLAESKTDDSEPVSTEAMETGQVDDGEDTSGGLLRNMENEVTSWAGDAEGDTAMSATTTTDEANIDKENITHQMDTQEKETVVETTQDSENENTELRNFSSITQLAAQDEKSKIAEKDDNTDLDLNKPNVESKANDNSSLNNGPLEIGPTNSEPVAEAEEGDGNNEDDDRDVPSLEDIESTLDEVNQSPAIVGVNGCELNENAIEAATSLKPVTIGSGMQPLEESMDANSIDDSREAFNTETMALIESSADEDSSCVGGLVINSVVGAAEALAQFPPDEEDTEQTGPKELMDISISGPTNEEEEEEEEEEGPAAKRLRLENGVEDPGKKVQDSDVKNVLLKIAPIKNGHGLWNAAKLKEILQNKGSILLRLHLSPDVAEANTKDDHNQDLSAIMIEVKDDDHIMGLSHLDSDEGYDPLAMSIVEHMSPMASQQPGSGRGRVTSGTPILGVGRSTSLQPAVPRGPGYQMDHLYDLEFEEPQHAWSHSGMDHQGYQHDQVYHHQVYQHDLHHQGYHQGYQHDQMAPGSGTPPKKLPSITTPQKGRILDNYGFEVKGSYDNPNSSRPLRYPPGSVTARGKKRGRPPLSYRNSFSPPCRLPEDWSPSTTPLPPPPQPPPAKIRKVLPLKPSLKFRAPTPPRNVFSSIKNTPKPSEIEARRAKLESRIEEDLKETAKINKEDEGPKNELTCPKLHAYKYMQISTKVLKNGTVKLVCVFCQTVFRKKTALQGHIRYKHRYMQQCPICKENLNSKDNKYILRFHILKEHKDVPAYQCEKCPEAFKLEHHLKNHKRMIHKIQEEKSEDSEATTTTTGAEETEEDDNEERNHISPSDDYDDEIDDDDMKENQVEREIQRIKRAREGEVEKTNKRREEAMRILEEFERNSKILEIEEKRRKEARLSGKGRGRGRGKILGSGIPRIGEDILKIPKKRGPKPKIKPPIDDNRLSDSGSGKKKPGPKPGWKQKQRLIEQGLIESSAEDQTEKEEEVKEEESSEREVESERRKGRGRGRGRGGGGKRGRSTTPAATAATTTALRRGRSPQKSKVPLVTATPVRKRAPPLRRDIGRTLRLESRRRPLSGRGRH